MRRLILTVLAVLLPVQAQALDAGQRASTTRDPSSNANTLILRRLMLPDEDNGSSGNLSGFKVIPNPAGAPGSLARLLSASPGIDAASGAVSLLNGPTIGLYRNGRFVSRPDAVEVLGAGSTGDLSATSALALGGSLTARTLAERWADTTRTKDFGAICDGVSHPLSQRFATLAAAQMFYPEATSLADEIDWAATQRALNARASAGAGLVELPGGLCELNRPLDMPETAPGYTRLHLSGQGAGTAFQPTATMPALLRIKTGNVIVSGIVFANRSGFAGTGLAINKPWNNLPIKVRDNRFNSFAVGISFEGDNGEIEGNSFNSNGTAVTLVRCVNSRIRSNSILGGNGFDFLVPDYAGGSNHCEGIKLTDNDTITSVPGAFSIRIRAGLMLDITNHMADGIKDGHGVIIDGTQAGVRSVTIKGGWIGGGVSTVGKFDGLHMEQVSNVMVSGLTVEGFSGYDVNATSVGFLGLFDINAHTATGLANVKLADVVGGRIVGGMYRNDTQSIVESGTTASRVLGAFLFGPAQKTAASQYFLNTNDRTPDLVLGGARGVDAVMAYGGAGAVGLIPSGTSANAQMTIASKGTLPVAIVANGVTALRAYGSILAADLPILLQGKTVASLPSCAVNAGAIMRVTDFSGARSYGGPLTGGGTQTVLVFCDGVAWAQN